MRVWVYGKVLVSSARTFLFRCAQTFPVLHNRRLPGMKPEGPTCWTAGKLLLVQIRCVLSCL